MNMTRKAAHPVWYQRFTKRGVKPVYIKPVHIKPVYLLFAVLITAHYTNAQPPVADPIRENLLMQARQVVADFQTQLSSKLQAAMQAGGPTNAIEVCSQEAPMIAQTVSQTYGLSIKRVSNKPRNPLAMPSPEATQALDEFAATLAEQDDPDLEKLLVMENGNHRYYKGIRIQPLCLNCHGENLSPAVQSSLQTFYPNDTATGYKEGDLRGAFVVEF